MGNENLNERALHSRGKDRRGVTRISPPPFYTREGKVLVERRSPCERRSNWIREFSLDTAGDGSTNTES
ncbi:MAG: hypothetical protein H6R13_752 [Proteobacteria bacterium]|nr:hypothetical protein [Pseudomonadota bacterium]